MASTITQNDIDNTNNQNQQAGQNQNNQQPGQGTQPPQNNNVNQPYQQQTGQPQQQSTIQSYNPNKQQGSGYTNIQRIVQANQNNRLGQAVGGGIQQQAGQQQQAIGQAQQNFQQQSQNNRFDTNANTQLVQNVLNDPTQYLQSATNPDGTPVQQLNQQGNQFQNLISGQYQGPVNLANAQQLQNQAQDVSQLGQAIGSTGGRIGLLQRFVGNPQYQQGQQTLDSLLLGQTGGQDLAAARRAALQAQGQTAGAIGGAQAQGQENINTAKQFGQNVQNQLGTNVTTKEAALAQQAIDTQTQRDKDVANIKAQLSAGTLTPELAAQLGIASGDRSYGINAASFLNPSDIKATEQNIATPEDYARFQALQQLAGTNTPQAAQDVFGKFSGQQAQAGTLAQNPAYNIDKSKFQDALQTAKQQYDAQLAPSQAKLAQMKDIVELVQQRDRNPPGSPGFTDIQNQINQKYPGAAQGGFTRSDWAQTEYQKAGQDYQRQLNALDASNQGNFNVSQS